MGIIIKIVTGYCPRSPLKGLETSLCPMVGLETRYINTFQDASVEAWADLFGRDRDEA